MIRIQWKSFTGYDLRLDIDDGASAVTSMTPAAHPFITSGDDSQEMFAPIRFQTGSIGIIGTLSDMQHLVGSYPLERPVTLYASNSGAQPQVMWRGYVQSATYSQSWQSGRQEIRIPVVSRLGVLDSFRPESATFIDSYESFASIIRTIGIALVGQNGFDGYVFPTFINPATTLGYKILMRNFARLDETQNNNYSYIIDSYDRILNDICTLFGHVCMEYKGYLCFISPDNTDGYVIYSHANLLEIHQGNSPTSPQSVTPTTINEHVCRADNNLSLLPGKGLVKVTGNVNPLSYILYKTDFDMEWKGDVMRTSQAVAGGIKHYASINYLYVPAKSIISPLNPNTNIRFADIGAQSRTSGCCISRDRIYITEGRINSYTIADDTGWQDRIIFRIGDLGLPHDFVSLISMSPTENYHNNGQTSRKYLVFRGNVMFAESPTAEWQNFTGIIPIVVHVSNYAYTKFVRVKDGKINGVQNRTGVVANLDGGYLFPFIDKEGNLSLEIMIPPRSGDEEFNTAYCNLDADNYYCITDLSFELTDNSEEPLQDEVPDTNIEQERIGNGCIESIETSLNFTTRRIETTPATSRTRFPSLVWAQFGSGIIMSNNVAYIPSTLYSSKTPEEALKDRLVAHFSTSKKILEATVRMPPQNWSYGPLQPWQSHSPDSIGTWAVLSQTIDWQEDTIEGMFFER